MNKYGYTKFNANMFDMYQPSYPIDPVQLVNLYFNNIDVINKLKDIRLSTRSLSEYQAITEILNYVSTGKTLSDIYTKPNGVVASTYVDYLTSINPVIGSYINALTVDQCDSDITKLLNILEDFIGSNKFKFLFAKIPTFSDENILEVHIQKIINVFKAYNINIFSMSISYDIDSKSSENIKVLDTCAIYGTNTTHNNVSICDTIGIHTRSNIETFARIYDDIMIMDSNTNIIPT